MAKTFFPILYLLEDNGIGLYIKLKEILSNYLV